LTRGAALPVLLALAACSGSPEQPTAPPTGESASAPPPTRAPASTAPAPVLTPLPQPTSDLAVLDSRDCRTVAQAYSDALARGDYAFAARVWDDPVIDGERLKAVFRGYGAPTIAIATIEQEGAAGSLYCTVKGTLTDGENASKSAQKGEIVLRRVNDVPGATAAELRWTVRSSSFVENVERTS
jgi:hypothetical protein